MHKCGMNEWIFPLCQWFLIFVIDQRHLWEIILKICIISPEKSQTKKSYVKFFANYWKKMLCTCSEQYNSSHKLENRIWRYLLSFSWNHDIKDTKQDLKVFFSLDTHSSQTYFSKLLIPLQVTFLKIIT